MSICLGVRQLTSSSTSSRFFQRFFKVVTALAVRPSIVQPSSVDRNQQRASYFCSFPRFPVKPSQQSTQDPYPPPLRYSHRRTSTVPNSNYHLSPEKQASLRPRVLPVLHVNVLSLNSPAPQQVSHRRTSSSPSKPTRNPSTRTVFTSAAKARPLRLVQESLNNTRKRKPPVFYAQSSHTFLRSLTYISIQHQNDNQKDSPPTTTTAATANMASSNPAVMPKVAPLPSIPTNPRPGGGEGGNKDRLLADLRRQVRYFRSYFTFIAHFFGRWQLTSLNKISPRPPFEPTRLTLVSRNTAR